MINKTGDCNSPWDDKYLHPITNPTPAQRMLRLVNEAVMDYGARMPAEWLSNAKEVLALTAAAEVKDAEIGWPENQIEDGKIKTWPAAAEVGEVPTKDMMVAHLDEQIRTLMAEKDATIERCAQVAESFTYIVDAFAGREIAAAIRNLKDGP